MWLGWLAGPGTLPRKVEGAAMLAMGTRERRPLVYPNLRFGFWHCRVRPDGKQERADQPAVWIRRTRQWDPTAGLAGESEAASDSEGSWSCSSRSACSACSRAERDNGQDKRCREIARAQAKSWGLWDGARLSDSGESDGTYVREWASRLRRVERARNYRNTGRRPRSFRPAAFHIWSDTQPGLGVGHSACRKGIPGALVLPGQHIRVRVGHDHHTLQHLDSTEPSVRGAPTTDVYIRPASASSDVDA